MREVLVRREQRQAVAHAQLSEQRVDGADLHTGTAASIAQACRTDVVVAFGLQQRESGKALDDLGLGFRTGKALQELLENESCRDDEFRAEQRIPEVVYLGRPGLGVAPKCKRPDAGVDQKRH